jgi:hypothetical protein
MYGEEAISAHGYAMGYDRPGVARAASFAVGRAETDPAGKICWRGFPLPAPAGDASEMGRSKGWD